MEVHQFNNIPLGEHGKQNTRQSITYDDFNDSTANNYQNDPVSFYMMSLEEIN